MHMPGGQLSIVMDEDYHLTMTGPVTAVGVFELHTEVVSQTLPQGA
jgi:diaminopimelate epimerase